MTLRWYLPNNNFSFAWLLYVSAEISRIYTSNDKKRRNSSFVELVAIRMLYIEVYKHNAATLVDACPPANKSPATVACEKALLWCFTHPMERTLGQERNTKWDGGKLDDEWWTGRCRHSSATMKLPRLFVLFCNFLVCTAVPNAYEGMEKAVWTTRERKLLRFPGGKMLRRNKKLVFRYVVGSKENWRTINSGSLLVYFFSFDHSLASSFLLRGQHMRDWSRVCFV